MTITQQDVAKLASLSRLEFSGEDADKIKGDLANILNFISKLQEVNTDGVASTFSPVSEEGTRERLDEITDTPDREALQKGAPSADMGFFVVPQVIE